MSATVLRLSADGRHRAVSRGASGLRGLRLGEVLVRLGHLTPERLLEALAVQPHEPMRLGDILIARGWQTPDQIATALAAQAGAERVDLSRRPPDPALLDRFGAAACLRTGLLPWRQAGAATVVIAHSLTQIRRHKAHLEAIFGTVRFAFATQDEIRDVLLTERGPTLLRFAENRVPASESVRGLSTGIALTLLSVGLLLGVSALVMPVPVLAALTALGVAAMIMTSGLRATAAVVQLVATHRRRRGFATSRADLPDRDLPVVSVLVPLLSEHEISATLVRRLSALDYPAHRLDICLIVEADDTLTRRTLARTDLPAFMRLHVVPRGAIRTKPRALNHALDTCHGSIVGVYDAEDAPAPDQLRKVARAFRSLPPEVACLQGVLDFYNARTNWLSRCFAIDYATWFRIILPGIARLGLVIPLGGTTLFFRRDALDHLGGWDAHNVTEDADLGLRLARHGYRCELIDTVTMEEANCRAVPWIRQRSRWLKGYALTWISHMRAPRRLLRELGAWKFLGVQVLFLGTLLTFVLSPLIWSFWALPFGLPHPLEGLVPWWAFVSLAAILITTELLNVAVQALAVTAPRQRWLIKWVPLMQFYYPLGAVASWKAILELIARPFFWDKTAHGVYGPDQGRA